VKRLLFSLAGTVALLAAVALAAACGGDDNSGGMMGSNGSSGGMSGMMSGNQPSGSIRVGLANWAVEPAQTSARAGSVTFWAVHEMSHQHMSGEGGATHDLQVMKRNSDGSFEMVGQVQGLTMGQARALTLSLAPGDYELSCNVVEQVNNKPIGHYTKGMHTSFTVTA
jgi:uncharacterized cupredoxin-like copper-binding protein